VKLGEGVPRHTDSSISDQFPIAAAERR
jgi:hypothetical protein